MRQIGVLTLLLTGVAHAQPLPDEPYYYEVAPPPAVVLCQPCENSSGPDLQLSANIGYMGYYRTLVPDYNSHQWFTTIKGHGLVFNGALVVSWEHNPKIGIRLSGFFGQIGNKDPTLLQDNQEATVRIFGGHAAVQGTFNNGLWIAKGIGVVRTQVKDNQVSNSDVYATSLPELLIAGGYNLHLSQHLALELSLEVASSYVTVRGSGYAGLLLQF